ncbi:hypothetical protein [Flavobacterium sp. W21_SRS_FM6]|uniref:hypothetical protein n=1 Tax=Flavobacterium sp. W21_SRS_FM6 TaxID=3240268 RepID=UPI003F8F5407
MFVLPLLPLVFLVLVTVLPCHADEQKRPKDMIFSYVEHPTMVNFLIPLIRASYKKLDIDTHFVPQPSNRNLRLVEDNKVDGDVGYMRIVLNDYKNLITVEPPVIMGIFTLLCQPHIPCTDEILADENQTLVVTSATQKGLEQGFKGELKTQFYTVNNISLIPEFISMKRFKYAIYPTSEKDLWRIKTADYQHVKLFESSLYHVLNKKYQFMADDISQALQLTLNEFAAKNQTKAP